MLAKLNFLREFVVVLIQQRILSGMYLGGHAGYRGHVVAGL